MSQAGALALPPWAPPHPSMLLAPATCAGGALEGHGKRGIRERRKALESRKDAPVMHIEARHAQVQWRLTRRHVCT